MEADLWRQFAAVIADRMYDPVAVMDMELRIKAVNHAFLNTFQLRPEEIESRLLEDLGGTDWHIPGLMPLLGRLRGHNGGQFDRIQIDHTFERIGRKTLVFNVHRLELDSAAAQPFIFLVVEDLAVYREAEAVLQTAYSRLEEQIAARTAELEAANALLQRELAERKQLENALRLNELRLSSIVEIAVDAIICFDAQQRIIRFNRGAETIFGYTADEIMGQSMNRLIPPRFVEAHNRHVERFTRGEKQSEHMHERSPIWGLCKDGREFRAEASISKVQVGGELTFTVILRDISRQLELENNLRQALERERELNELRGRFIAMISHELRTPLAVILSSSQLLENYGPRLSADKQKQYFDHIRQQVLHLTELLEDTLAVSRAETVGLEFEPQTGDLERLCQSVVQRVQITVQETHRIVFTASDVCRAARFDERLVWRILNNLLSNAVKYSPDGGEVSVNLTCEGGQAVLRVQDQGIGIPAADLPRLFESFYRGSNVGAIPGTGLGLAIVRQAVRTHGGTITCDSREGQGTTFTVTLPIV